MLYIKCFACLGHGFQVYEVCHVCKGTKVLNAKEICTCGRPATRTVKDKIICNALMCEERVTKGYSVTVYNQSDFENQYMGAF
jgi:DnaJ-class molecular chaperone